MAFYRAVNSLCQRRCNTLQKSRFNWEQSGTIRIGFYGFPLPNLKPAFEFPRKPERGVALFDFSSKAAAVRFQINRGIHKENGPIHSQKMHAHRMITAERKRWPEKICNFSSLFKSFMENGKWPFGSIWPVPTNRNSVSEVILVIMSRWWLESERPFSNIKQVTWSNAEIAAKSASKCSGEILLFKRRVTLFSPDAFSCNSIRHPCLIGSWWSVVPSCEWRGVVRQNNAQNRYPLDSTLP